MKPCPRTGPPLERFHRIVRLLNDGPCTSNEIAARLEVTRKTVWRDVEFMRSRLGVRIVSVGQDGYELESTVNLCACCAKPL